MPLSSAPIVPRMFDSFPSFLLYTSNWLAEVLLTISFAEWLATSGDATDSLDLLLACCSSSVISVVWLEVVSSDSCDLLLCVVSGRLLPLSSGESSDTCGCFCHLLRLNLVMLVLELCVVVTFPGLSIASCW